MTAGWFLTYHQVPEVVQAWLARLGVRDPERGSRDLADLAQRAGQDSLADVDRLAVLLDAILPRCSDPGMALANLDRFLAAVPRPAATLARSGRRYQDDRDPAASLQHQPVLHRDLDPRSRAARLAAGRA